MEMWLVIACYLRTSEKWSLLGLCKNACEAVVLGVEAPAGSKVFNREQAMAFIRVSILGQSIWLTGKAGSGKSYVIRAVATAVAQACGSDSVAICAPTGTAAKVASVDDMIGTTLHFGFNIRSRKRARGEPLVQIENQDAEMTTDETMHANETGEHMEGGDPNIVEGGAPTCVLDNQTKKRLRAKKLIVIDETSMASSEMIDLVDSALKKANSSNAPFGGVPIMAVADFFQLEPVMSMADIQRAGGKKWAFESDAWAHLRPVQLTKVVRQKDWQYVAVLNRMRVGKTTDEDMHWIKRHSRKIGSAELAIFPSNAKCKRRNDLKLASIDSPLITIHASYDVVQGVRLVNGRYEMRPLSSQKIEVDRIRWSSADIVKRGPNGEAARLNLKAGCRVRCLRNIYEGRYGLDRELQTSNGQLGTVTSIDSDHYEVVRVMWDALGEGGACETAVHKVAWVCKQTFKIEGCSVFAISWQVPLALAAAITIHSAQGGTFSQHLDVDPRGMEPVYRLGKKKWIPKPASAYVAMSRATCISNVRVLPDFSKDDVAVDKFVLAYYRRVFGEV